MRRYTLDDHSWLATGRFDCLGCGVAHDAVLLSPLHEGYRFFCGDCPIRMRVTLADADRLTHASHAITEHAPGRRRWTRMCSEIEDLLAHCRCGGAFRFQAARRCAYCLTPLLRVPSPSWDSWPASITASERHRLERLLVRDLETR